MKLLPEVVEGSGGIRKLQVALKMPPKFTAFKLSDEINKPIYFNCKCNSFNCSLALAFWIGSASMRNTNLLTHKFLI